MNTYKVIPNGIFKRSFTVEGECLRIYEHEFVIEVDVNKDKRQIVFCASMDKVMIKKIK